ncbi:hypothetical protein DPMN_144972 [Dreissena polymorpha]|uniref:Uncharacterized protein n=1 Tax=Dreissena polymorpha TaxID=45954 RepID=A0A9D4F7G0_DREPO|nr:hypothetical protein DPMN_144972 [Dreissena polymorpha]
MGDLPVSVIYVSDGINAGPLGSKSGRHSTVSLYKLAHVARQYTFYQFQTQLHI